MKKPVPSLPAPEERRGLIAEAAQALLGYVIGMHNCHHGTVDHHQTASRPATTGGRGKTAGKKTGMPR